MASTFFVTGVMILAAVALPGFCIVAPWGVDWKKHTIMTIASMAACAAALCALLFEVNYRVGVADWSALMDLSGTMAQNAVLLIAITTGLNIAAAVRVGKAA